MKKVTLQNYATDKYYPRIVKAVDNELKFQNFVAPIRVFVSRGLLEAQDINNWRKGRVPYLEKVIKCNLAKAGRILRILRFHAHDLNLKPSMTVYRRKTAGGKIPLRFSKTAEKNVEEAYARHFVKLGKSNVTTPQESQAAERDMKFIAVGPVEARFAALTQGLIDATFQRSARGQRDKMLSDDTVAEGSQDRVFPCRK
jgi:hypothetical protein